MRLLVLLVGILFWFAGCGGGSGSDGGSNGGSSGGSNSNGGMAILSCDPSVFANGLTLKTGQTMQLDSNKDDGFYKKGAARNYKRDDEKHIVLDCATKLMWQDDEEATSTKKSWLLSHNAIGNFDNTSGDTAATYCLDLTLGGFYDWRLPTIEVMSILDYEYGKPVSKLASVFRYIKPNPNVYWSATSDPVTKSSARVVEFTHGSEYYSDKKDQFFVRCVRGGEAIAESFARDDSTETVIDDRTKLVWQDNSETFGDANKKTLDQAMTYCENLNLAGRDDWRLPNINELLSIVDYTRTGGSYYQSIFKSLKATEYLSSTSTKFGSITPVDLVFVVDASNGFTTSKPKSDTINVVCVTDKK